MSLSLRLNPSHLSNVSLPLASLVPCPKLGSFGAHGDALEHVIYVIATRLCSHIDFIATDISDAGDRDKHRFVSMRSFLLWRRYYKFQLAWRPAVIAERL